VQPAGSQPELSVVVPVRTEDQPTHILLVDNHQVVSDALKALLNQEPDMVVVGSAVSVADSVPMAKALDPDIVILEFHLKDGSGADLAAGLRHAGCEAPLIFLTWDERDVVSMAAVEAGASAVVHKSRAGADVIRAVRTVSRGETLIPPSTIASLISRSRERTHQAGRLSAREMQVLRLMAEGHPSREIATKLGISYATVRTHMRSLGSKLEVHSKLEIIVKARRLALIVDWPLATRSPE
jgi:DNA-binding NarL/FixJ family response regulator